MTAYEQVEATITVPKNTGVDGLLHALREVLKRPRIQSIQIDSKARITYSHYVPEGMVDGNIGVSFEQLEPNYVVQHSDIREVQSRSHNAAVAVGQLFSAVAGDHLHPVAFVSGADTVLWRWYKSTTGVCLPEEDSLFGLPLYRDRFYEDDVLLLCAGYGKDAGFVDTQATYKVFMEEDMGPITVVKVL